MRSRMRQPKESKTLTRRFQALCNAAMEEAGDDLALATELLVAAVRRDEVLRYRFGIRGDKVLPYILKLVLARQYRAVERARVVHLYRNPTTLIERLSHETGIDLVNLTNREVEEKIREWEEDFPSLKSTA